MKTFVVLYAGGGLELDRRLVPDNMTPSKFVRDLLHDLDFELKGNGDEIRVEQVSDEEYRRIQAEIDRADEEQALEGYDGSRDEIGRDTP